MVMPRWSDLPIEISGSIADHLSSFIDFVRFRAVCRSWRSATASTHNRTFLPYLVVPMTLDEDEYVGYQSSSWIKRDDHYTPEIHKLFLPSGSPLECHVSLPQVPGVDRWFCFGSCHSWLGFIDCKDWSSRLIHAFSGETLDLPSFKGMIPRALCLSSPNPITDPNSVIVVIHDCYKEAGYPKLGYARPGDTAWTLLPGRGRHQPEFSYQDVVFHDGKFFAVRFDRAIVMLDFSQRDPEEVEIVPQFKPYHGTRKYLVVLPSGELLQVIRNVDSDDQQVNYITVGFEVYKIHYGGEFSVPFEPVENLGDWTLFVGRGTSIALPSSLVSGYCRANSIYYTDNIYHIFRMVDGGYDMGIYRLDNDSISLHCPSDSQKFPPPIWIVPQL